MVCDGFGTALGEVTNSATGKQLTYKRNYYAETQFSLSHQDPVAVPLMAAVANGPMPTLKCYRQSIGSSQYTLRFNGTMAPFTEALSETAMINAVFRSPFGRLYGDGSSGSGRFTNGPNDGVGAITALSNGTVTLDAIAQSLILLYGGAGVVGNTDAVFGINYAETSFAGLGIGNINTAGALINPSSVIYAFSNVGQAIQYLSEMLGGFDFDETFVDQGTTQALFNTYASQGSARVASFQYGPGTGANVAQITRATSPPANVIQLIGGNGFVSVQEDTVSSAKWGRWYQSIQATDATTQAQLDARAKGLVVSSPVRTFTIQPDYSVPGCPRPWDDFWLGDTVGFYGRRGAFSENLQTRINEIDVVVDDNGFETAAIPDPFSASDIVPDLLHTAFAVQA